MEKDRLETRKPRRPDGPGRLLSGEHKGFDSLQPSSDPLLNSVYEALPARRGKRGCQRSSPLTRRRKPRRTKPNGFTGDARGRIRYASPTANAPPPFGKEGRGALPSCFPAKTTPHPTDSPKTRKRSRAESTDNPSSCLSLGQSRPLRCFLSSARRLNGPEVGVQRLPAVGL